MEAILSGKFRSTRNIDLKNNDSEKLLTAVARNNLEELNSVLEDGADINCVDSAERSSLIHAAIDKKMDVVDLLLNRGADVNVQDFQDMTPLHFAAQNYDMDMCKRLVAAGAKIDAQDDNGNTPLWRAEFESGGSTELQEFLLSKGANEELKNHHGVSPKDLKEA